MNIKRSWESKNFNVTVVIESKNEHAHSFCSDHRYNLESIVRATASGVGTVLETDFGSSRQGKAVAESASGAGAPS